MTDINLSDMRKVLGGSAVAVAVTIVVIIALVYFDILTLEFGELLISAVLAAGTFGYVLLTLDMSRSMREEMRLQRQQFKLERKSEVIEALESEVLPLYHDVTNLRDAMTGTRSVSVAGERYRMYPYVPTKFKNPSTVPRLLQSPIDINPGDAFDFYSTYQEYRQVYGDTIRELEKLILTELDSPPDDQEDIRELAMLALQLKTEKSGATKIAWEARKEDIIPLRKEVPELIRELEELRQQLKSDGGKLSAELSDAINDTTQEYWIDGSQLNPDPVPTEWKDNEIGQTNVYIGELPYRPQFASSLSDGEATDYTEMKESEPDNAEE